MTSQEEEKGGAINIHALMSLPTGQRHRLLADRLHTSRAWAHEHLFAAAFAEAAAIIYEDDRL
ncbi:hypothetical protein [Streptomyces chartreusis]|uniref:hypothetical protein n=1 Tax=Streptomyces chartreusis TaxID=1969 RepID=UPI002E18AD32